MQQCRPYLSMDGAYGSIWKTCKSFKHHQDVIRHNHRGHGIDIDENERGHYDDMNIIAQDAYEIAQTLHGSNNNIPIGHSMGSLLRVYCREISRHCARFDSHWYWSISKI